MNVAALEKQLLVVRIRWHWFGRSAKLEDWMMADMLSSLSDDEGQADLESYRASKVLYNTRMPVLKALSVFKSKLKNWYESPSVTLPHVEPGFRLVRQKDRSDLVKVLSEQAEALKALAQALQDKRPAVLEDAKRRLKKGFNPANYPADLTTLFGLEWSFPSLKPPDYLASEDPAAYHEEMTKYLADFKKSLEAGEQLLLAKLGDLVKGLAENLKPAPDGSKKKLHAQGVENLLDFLKHVRHLNVTDSQDLVALAGQAQAVLSGVGVDDLKDSAVLRAEIGAGLDEVAKAIVPLVKKQTRRNIIQLKEKNGENSNG